ncbi:hypothetical protein PHYBLDRAFT_172672 [Phycomyces blakesleeanus NRRL 1555(-)]|uniref:Uncharacterized protein n=1 Tax=Phycomyces blakesleeanus (strain ATCC 8743b / DSM 1359 / FGSC 10004 / NBRC 33097 / NRRL 1555) TaxID=763407 RepID=A0A167L283_PHYB8|nr:hypothetical protein PHYBLDRAFT_172672 [Phycomyces blakesleeanus NRRL 1555(-)]OAD69427.1 hypothetical protein PHYBLDRAFT_172672 [Phycomyces blakesleeanus NRRL 1555(-)]|eukprot:XP_018287467.1 hypothetical protein PHYBLDRAFT_172672 [Phycomyces blakesleeanus NRRL 1555(-)]
MLIVFCMLLVPFVQVKHQGSNQSPRLSVSIPSRSSFKVQVKVHRFSIHSIQVKLQGSRQGPRFSDQGPRFSGISKLDEQLLPCFCIFLVSIPSSFYLLLVSAIQVKCQGPDFLAMGIAIDVWRQGCDLPAKCSIIQVNQQDSDLPSMCSANHVKHPGSHLPAMVIDCSVIQVKHLGSDRQSMVIAIQDKHQGSDLPAMAIVSSYPGQASRFPSPRHGYSSSLWLSRSSFKVLISHYMVIVLNPSRSCFTDPDSVRGYRPNSKDQNSNLDYSSNIKDLISNQGYGYTLFSLSLHAFFRIGLVCLRSGYTMKNLFSFQCDRYIHLVWPLVTVGFISLLASQSKPVIMDPISVQCYSVLAVKVPLLSMPMIPNPSPIQSDRATIKDSISIQYDSQGQSILVYCPLGQTELPKFYYLPSARVEANDQSFDILLGSQQAFNAQLYIKGRRYTRIFKQFTKN